MKAINFKRQGVLYYLHKFLFKDNPEDTCTYRGHLIICTIMCGVTLHATLLRSILFIFEEERNNKSNWGILPHLFAMFVAYSCIIIGVFVLEGTPYDYINWHEISIFKMCLLSFIPMFVGIIFFIIIITIAVIIGGIIYYVGLLGSKLLVVINRPIKKLYITSEGEPRTQAGILYNSWKDKLCKRIDWK